MIEKTSDRSLNMLRICADIHLPYKQPQQIQLQNLHHMSLLFNSKILEWSCRSLSSFLFFNLKPKSTQKIRQVTYGKKSWNPDF